jgi:sterol desaturase/sphingolipid hydroxylase (fatty acid hydroxylase superfamily)
MTLAVVILALLAWELFFPGKPLLQRGRARLLNVAAGLLNALLMRLILPAGLATWATLVEQQMDRPTLHWFAGLLVLDLALYWQHRACHLLPVLWRLHAPHHTDNELDLTTGFRFHPLEAACSAFWKGLIVLVFGISASTAVIFEILLAAGSCFSHANLRLPPRLARTLSWLWMTPHLHRVHHQLAPELQKTNLGFGMTLWDWLFGTYRDPSWGKERVGLTGSLGHEPEKPAKFISLPFVFKRLA